MLATLGLDVAHGSAELGGADDGASDGGVAGDVSVILGVAGGVAVGLEGAVTHEEAV